MLASIERNMQFLSDLFSGPFTRHGVILRSTDGMESRVAVRRDLGDFICSDAPVSEWVPGYVAAYEHAVRDHETIGDDSVPYIGLNTNTGVFAAAFGCPLHVFDGMDTNACALPVVETPQQADALPEPTVDTPPLNRVFELGDLLQRELGDDAVIGVPDIQSPFDIAALVWKKEDLLMTMYDAPEAVERLVDRVLALLTDFFEEFLRRYPNANLCHCPYAWAPSDQGVWLSEDEAGAISTEMFEQFCLPSLVALSERFGGLFMHCCAAADHQYDEFRKIPNLRGVNRVFQEPGPKPAVEAFSGETVLIQAWLDETAAGEFLDMALPETRFLFNLNSLPTDEAKATVERLRERCAAST